MVCLCLLYHPPAPNYSAVRYFPSIHQLQISEVKVIYVKISWMKCLSYIQGAVFVILYRLRNSLLKKIDYMRIFKWNPPGFFGGKLQEFKIGQMSVSGWFQVDFCSLLLHDIFDQMLWPRIVAFKEAKREVMLKIGHSFPLRLKFWQYSGTYSSKFL